MKLIECVPNFSEGSDIAVIEAIRDRIAAVAGVSVLHVTSDRWHNRSVITFVAPADAMVDAAVAAIRAARDHIDLTRHSGVHPRIGAADVVPFVPLDGATMDDCIAIARAVGQRVGDELAIPVYLYERAASRPSHRNLADVRRGGFETLRDAIGSDPDRAPDFGPARVHPTAGAVAIGARPFLVAFNCYLGDAVNLEATRQIARAVRESSGGLPAVKALALEVDGQAQLSMNLVDTDRTSLAVAYAAVEREARARGLDVAWSEIIGLVPERVVSDLATRSLKLRDDAATHVLERRILAAHTDQSLKEYVESVGDSDPFPGGGSVAAIAGSLAAALVSMVAGLTIGRDRYAAVDEEMRRTRASALALATELQSLAALDAESYARVTDARKLPRANDQGRALREEALRAALLRAIETPLAVSRAALRVARLAHAVAESGNTNAITDAGVAALLASAACTGACYNVRVNVRALRDPSEGDAAAREAIALAADVEAIAASIARTVNAALGGITSQMKHPRSPESGTASRSLPRE
jgi:glutamate formiminotransferase / formiminotetrahydrofolate cyclodeaminase